MNVSIASTQSEPHGFDVLFEDPHLIVVNKPAPLLTQAPPGIDSLEARVKAYIKQKYQKPAGVYLGVPHRLDRPVSGVIVFARNTKAAQRIHEQFQQRRVIKRYQALVSGTLPITWPEVWEDYLVKLAEESRTIVAPASETPGAKLARLRPRLLCKLADDQAVLELEPETGRSHQLRVQCAVRGLPIVGDSLYGSPLPFGQPKAEPRERLIGLHASELSFHHPFSKQQIHCKAPLPSYWPRFTQAGHATERGMNEPRSTVNMKKTVAIIGASSDRRKYGNKAVRAHLAAGYEVFPIHPTETTVEGLPVYRSIAEVPAERLDRVTVYLPPAKVLTILPTLRSKPIGSFLLNPGTESEEVLAEAQRLGLQPILGCSIIAAGVTPDQFPDV